MCRPAIIPVSQKRERPNLTMDLACLVTDLLFHIEIKRFSTKKKKQEEEAEKKLRKKFFFSISSFFENCYYKIKFCILYVAIACVFAIYSKSIYRVDHKY